MLINLLADTLERSGALEHFWGKLDAGQDATIGVASSARPFLVAARFALHPQPTLVVVPGEEGAETFARMLGAYIGEENVYLYEELSENPFTLVPLGGVKDFEKRARQSAHRLEALWALQSGKHCVVVASARALLRKVVPAAEKIAAPLVLRAGEELSDQGILGVEEYEDLVIKLVDMGYENTGKLAGPGTFSAQGGTIDVFAGNLVNPVRLDFFGDELEEIRSILPGTGQTFSSREMVEIFPVREYEITGRGVGQARARLVPQSTTTPIYRDLIDALDKTELYQPQALLPYLYEEAGSVGEYLAPGSLTVVVEPRSLIDDALHYREELLKKADASVLLLEEMFFTPQELNFGANQRATYVSIMRVGVELDDELVVKRVDVAGDQDKLFGKLLSLTQTGFTVVFSVPHFRARQEMKLELVDRGIPIKEELDVLTSGDLEAPGASEAAGSDVGDTGDVGRGTPEEDIAPKDTASAVKEPRKPKLQRGLVNIVDVDIPLGMIFPAAKLALVSLADTQGSMAVRRARRIDVTDVTFPYKPGDYVVHAHHGVAFFRDLVRRDVGGVERDYLLLEYAEGDKLYVPVEQFDRVTRYVGPEGSSPRLTRLNTSDWSRAIGRARKATKKLAFDLVDVYTRRSATKGYQYKEDTPWQHQMEEAFPYQETPDQLAAIADVKTDMQSIHPMDRLVCGDVGFGKTEVALRAAFKATQDHKQVMVLCPTTILAQQHYTTFKERFDPFGVRVEVLSRFRTPKQQKKTLEDFANGEVQVLIGTHRLLSRDVNPKDLGLVIIDEEQRFGVGHKEQLKNMRESIDILTLSATPIPRTMQMGLSGVRDMSLIMSPPDDRRPVEVHVGEWDPDLVADAIRRELDRKGQVYYVSNRVRSIDEAVKRVRAAAGEARIGVAHGKMSKEELEIVMEDFSAGQIDVLVATTIVESGLDNPHTNTLIIEDSQRLGLAQMYQLKGRVGRSSTQAYAYFLFPDNVPLTEEARERLIAIDENADLGSGMRIAMKDLEIRGAGSILGAEQSGNMSAVGFDLYAQMLAQAVTLTREGATIADNYLPEALSDIVINVPDHTYIPEEYVPDADERVMFYRKLASADSIPIVDELAEEIVAKHGEMPPATVNQFQKARLKAFASEHNIESISVTGGRLVVEPITLTKAQASQIRKKSGRYLADKKKLMVPMRVVGQSEDGTTLTAVQSFLESLYT
ncbi:transcription-repair coupling factor [Anaerotardibacter muris]|uniref:transcription-repair coupling factor n=1 Tax=Anaerotardibacter muris TaxID=2941505 RepID=UPI00203DDFB2|nr:transcription-repair coupling factor [Anaerotardibacter muris]